MLLLLLNDVSYSVSLFYTDNTRSARVIYEYFTYVARNISKFLKLLLLFGINLTVYIRV